MIIDNQITRVNKILRIEGFEPTQLVSHWNLNPICLPIPSYPHVGLVGFEPTVLPL